jgi:exopolysaccharide biosynthesis polyprenyl glycosylphosphotransferase
LGTKRVLVVGTVRSSAWVLHDIANAPAAGVRVLGLVTDEPDPKLPEETKGTRIFQGVDRTARLAARTHAEEVVLCLPDRSGAKLVEMLHALWPLGVRAYVLSPELSVYLRRADVPQHAFHGLALLDFGRSPMSNASPRRKRVFDLVFGTFLLVACAPFLALIALFIWITDGRPVLYRQERCGANGRRFMMWKFRTMHVGADRMLDEVMGQNEAQGPIFKIRKDPRVTPFGAFLRRHSLDELPQIWNVLRGEMSLVGPRPPLPAEVENYEPWHYARLAGVVGCTGLWQVSGRSNLNFDEMAMLDIYYLHNMNNRLDFKVLLRTVETVLIGQGAY